MVQSMVSVVVISLMVWVSIPHMGTSDPLGMKEDEAPKPNQGQAPVAASRQDAKRSRSPVHM